MNAPSWTAWAREQWHGITEDEVSALLWQCTCYPLGTLDEVEAQFIAIRDRSGGNVGRALWMVNGCLNRRNDV